MPKATTKSSTKKATKTAKKPVAKKAVKTVKAAKKVAKTTAKKTVKKTTKKTTQKNSKSVAKKAVKKTARKTSAAKKSPRTTTKKSATKKPLVTASNEQSFWVSDGQILNSLLALQVALDEMTKAVYEYHAFGNQNDFANWVEVVLCDQACANALRDMKTRRSAKTVVVTHLKLYAV